MVGPAPGPASARCGHGTRGRHHSGLMTPSPPRPGFPLPRPHCPPRRGRADAIPATPSPRPVRCWAAWWCSVGGWLCDGWLTEAQTGYSGPGSPGSPGLMAHCTVVECQQTSPHRQESALAPQAAGGEH